MFVCNCWVWIAAAIAVLCVGGIFLIMIGYSTGEAHARSEAAKE